MCEQWFAAQEVDPFELARRLYRVASVLWDGTTTWALLEGHPTDVASQARVSGLREVDPLSLPPLPKHRWSLAPSEVSSLRDDGHGPFIAEVGVGVVHRTEPQPPRAIDPAIAALAARVKDAFDPTGRLAPGRLR
jgi:glycolate oxidase FAD binding subunit